MWRLLGHCETDRAQLGLVCIMNPFLCAAFSSNYCYPPLFLLPRSRDFLCNHRSYPYLDLQSIVFITAAFGSWYLLKEILSIATWVSVLTLLQALPLEGRERKGLAGPKTSLLTWSHSEMALFQLILGSVEWSLDREQGKKSLTRICASPILQPLFNMLLLIVCHFRNFGDWDAFLSTSLKTTTSLRSS